MLSWLLHGDLTMLQVFVNLYSAHMDPDDWQQPQQFRPERFLDQSGNVIGKDRVIAFSLGKLSITLMDLAWFCMIMNRIMRKFRKRFSWNLVGLWNNVLGRKTIKFLAFIWRCKRCGLCSADTAICAVMQHCRRQTFFSCYRQLCTHTLSTTITDLYTSHLNYDLRPRRHSSSINSLHAWLMLILCTDYYILTCIDFNCFCCILPSLCCLRSVNHQ